VAIIVIFHKTFCKLLNLTSEMDVNTVQENQSLNFGVNFITGHYFSSEASFLVAQFQFFFFKYFIDRLKSHKVCCFVDHQNKNQNLKNICYFHPVECLLNWPSYWVLFTMKKNWKKK
jgi:hypothetical protein